MRSVGISSYVYSNLNDEVKYGLSKNSSGEDEKTNMWIECPMKYNDKDNNYYSTSWFWKI